MLAGDDPAAPGHELLHELHRTGVWIEQEVFSHHILVPDGDAAARTTRHDDASAASRTSSLPSWPPPP